MADAEQLEILRQGVSTWNAWRAQSRRFIPDLFEPNLVAAILNDVDLRDARLDGAQLENANLVGADLSGADLRGASFRGADLSAANLSWANASGASFARANLRGANLQGANLTRIDLRGTDLSDTSMFSTLLGDVHLSDAKGLETVRHYGPSMVGLDTIYRSEAKIPEIFLRGAGVPDEFIAYMTSLVANPIEFYSCFLSYSSRDGEFAERLHGDLRNRHVRCWFAPEDLRIGDRFRPKIDEAIRVYDKLLLVLSEESVRSPWVETEVESAFEKERRQDRVVLFPIRLDDAVMETNQAWAADIRRTRHIGDFRHWKKHESYKEAFVRLLRDLKPEQRPAEKGGS
jgi:uncharacterized protein YjbI with pentapeptide repeats